MLRGGGGGRGVPGVSEMVQLLNTKCMMHQIYNDKISTNTSIYSYYYGICSTVDSLPNCKSGYSSKIVNKML